VRQLRPEPIPQEVVDAVLDVARWSGSASNKQPWEFIVIRNKVNALIRGYLWLIEILTPRI
jgi:nitroreductase